MDTIAKQISCSMDPSQLFEQRLFLMTSRTKPSLKIGKANAICWNFQLSILKKRSFIPKKNNLGRSL